MKAMILAAGHGTRLRPYTNHTPKPLFSIGGRPLLDKIIHQLEQAGCRAVIINTHHLHEQIESFLAGRNYGLEVHTRHEPQILGTGGAIKNVSDFWDQHPFMVVNADIVADIDLAAVYDAHQRQQSAATLVVCDDPKFNSVIVARSRSVQGFVDRSRRGVIPAGALLTFTGVQVLDPVVLNYIPAGKPYSSIDAFRKMLAANEEIGAFVISKDRWQDIGTPLSYRRAAVDRAIPQAFEAAFAAGHLRPVDRVKLKGDGSQRQWYRLKSGRNSLIMVDHGIRQKRATSEVDSFVRLGKHLYRRKVSVPRIYSYDTFSGLVFLEDLGDIHLQQVVKAMDDPHSILRLYQAVIDQLIRLFREGGDTFDAAWTYQTPVYDQNLILDKECRYFQEAFLNGLLGYRSRYADFEPEFNVLAAKALQAPTIGFMHRDMQSRNIMLKDEVIYFIDFQGGRIGPIQYDLAALLIDPYVELPQDIQGRLLDYALKKLSTTTPLEPQKFRACYHYCAIARNLQILGAFAYLSNVMGKTQFSQYIPAAVRTLRSFLKADQFPYLTKIVNEVYQFYETSRKF